jgi:RES domain-containing protein
MFVGFFLISDIHRAVFFVNTIPFASSTASATSSIWNRNYVAVPVGIDKALSTTIGTLPRDWQESPPPPSTRALGSEWAASRTSAILRVPSAIVPIEHNYLLNPLHPGASRVAGGKPVRLPWDSRLGGKG